MKRFDLSQSSDADQPSSLDSDFLSFFLDSELADETLTPEVIASLQEKGLDLGNEEELTGRDAARMVENDKQLNYLYHHLIDSFYQRKKRDSQKNMNQDSESLPQPDPSEPLTPNGSEEDDEPLSPTINAPPENKPVTQDSPQESDISDAPLNLANDDPQDVPESTTEELDDSQEILQISMQDLAEEQENLSDASEETGQKLDDLTDKMLALGDAADQTGSSLTPDAAAGYVGSGDGGGISPPPLPPPGGEPPDDDDEDDEDEIIDPGDPLPDIEVVQPPPKRRHRADAFDLNYGEDFLPRPPQGVESLPEMPAPRAPSRGDSLPLPETTPPRLNEGINNPLATIEGDASAAGAALSGLAATAGTLGLAFSTVAGAVNLFANAANQAADVAFGFAPETTQASMMVQLEELRGDIRRSRENDEELARFVTTQSEISESIKDIKNKFLGIAMSAVLPAMEKISDIIQLLENIIDMIPEEVKGIAEEVGDAVTDPLSYLLEQILGETKKQNEEKYDGIVNYELLFSSENDAWFEEAEDEPNAALNRMRNWQPRHNEPEVP